MSNEKLMLKWFEKMTMQELQDGEKIPEMNAVKTAMAECYQGSGTRADNVKINYNIKFAQLEISYTDENGNKQKHPFHELSDGFKNTLSLVGDIAYRMAVLNPQFFADVTKKTPGIILIDEIDQHLHPKWQKNIVKNLMSIFPNVQFIVTTHSPSIISSVKKGQLILLDNHECYSLGSEIYGKDVNSVMSEIMDVEPRPDDICDKFNRFYSLLDEEKFDLATKLLEELKTILPADDNGLIGAEAALDFEVG
jgi:predicted ATP-binding protein involved in virulence